MRKRRHLVTLTFSLDIGEIVWSEGDGRRFLDQLQIAQGRQLQSQILQCVRCLVHNQHVHHNVVPQIKTTILCHYIHAPGCSKHPLKRTRYLFRMNRESGLTLEIQKNLTQIAQENCKLSCEF